MKFRLTPRHTPIAIDVQTASITAVQWHRQGGTWRRTLNVSIPRQTGATDALNENELVSLEKAFARQRAVGADIVLIAPSAETCIEPLELPPRGSQTPFEQLARAEMTRLSRWDESIRFQLVTWDTPTPLRRAAADARPTTTTLYAAALPETAVAEVVKQWSARGRSVRQIVPMPVVAARVPTLVADFDTDKPVLVIDVRWDRSALTIVRDGVAIYHRELPDNGLSLLSRSLIAEVHLSSDEVAEAIRVGGVEVGGAGSRASTVCESFAEALAGEVEASVAFASRRFGDGQTSKLMLIGAGSKIGGLERWLAERLEIPADESSTSSPTLVCDALAFAASEASDGQSLLPAAQRDFLKRETVARRWLYTAASLAIVGGIATGALYASTLSSTQPDELRLANIDRDQTRLDAAAAEANARLAVARQTAAFRERLLHQPEYSTVFRLVGGALGSNTLLRSMDLSEPIGSPNATSAKPLRQLRLAGTAAETASLTRLMASLRAIDVFANVELVRTSRGLDGTGVSFELSLDIVAPAIAAAGKKAS